MRVQSEDEGEGTRRIQDIFYPKEGGPDTIRDGTPTRRSENGNQDNIGGGPVGYLQWAREDK